MNALKKGILPFLLFFAPQLLIFGQAIQIRWTAPSEVLDSNFRKQQVLYFEGATTRKNLFPYFTLSLYNTNVASFSLVNEVYAPVSETEAKILSNKTVPSSPEIRVGIYNRAPVSRISFVPIRYNASSGMYEKLVSFEYQIERGVFQQSSRQPVLKSTRQRSNAKISATGASVLSSGKWFRLAVASSGIHKIDYTYLKSLGINPDGIDPRKIQLYGNGGGMLPQANSAARADDLIQNSIFVSGENDGVFNQNDYVLFYAKGPTVWEWNSSEGIFNHEKNLYSDYSFYFLTIGFANGARVVDTASTGGAVQTLSVFDDYTAHETDAVNLLTSGREWYGEVFNDNLTRTFNFNTQGIVNGQTVKVTSCVLGRSVSATGFNVFFNGGLIGSQSLGPNNTSAYDAKGVERRTVMTTGAISGSPSTSVVTLTYNQGSSATSIGQLNYLELNFKRALALYGNETNFRAVASTSAASTSYEVANATGSSIWNVSDISSVKNQQYTVSGGTATFSANSGMLEEYVVFTGRNFPKPQFVEVVANQNLHGINVPNLPDMVIVTAPLFEAEARMLANYRKSKDNLDVTVVTTQEVYNEFSSGAQDVSAIRDFMKMLYDRKSGLDSIRYLLLFGDCSYDYKNRIPGNTNFVPIYESRESLLPLSSYSSDDYFAFLDDSEGTWGEAPSEDDIMDIGVGRLPVKSSEEANAVLIKLAHYSGDVSCLGKWRNSITFVSDDGDGNLHSGDADFLATYVESTYPNYNINKIYLDGFPQLPSPGGEKAPAVNSKIDEDVNKGTFILNYSGHGGEVGWAQENILDVPQIESWENFNTMPFMVAATCDFGRYDDPARVSGAEVAVIRAGGGSIGIIASTRVVYQFSNKALNSDAYKYIFKPMPNGAMPRLGDVVKATKNASIVGVNNRNFALLGDPSMMLGYPSQSIKITKIKNNTVSATPDTLKALSKVVIEGEITNSSGTLLAAFNGKLSITIYDKKSNMVTYGTEGGPIFPFTLRNNFLFDGNASVVNGKWSISFVVPKDISYQYDFGKISAYAHKSGSFQDATGSYTNVIIGGTDPTAPSDNIPPRIQLYMNDESFVFGGLTDKDALFIAKLSDENGINTAGSGIGHEIAATLDNAEKPIVLNQFYTSNLNDYKKGTVKYSFKELSPGHHSIRLKAWDTYNNSAESVLDFMVASNEKMALSHVLNYPNPFTTHTVFHFDHNRAGEELDVMVQIYTVSGKLIKTLETKVYASGAHFSGLDWNGKDDFGDSIGKGVYVYRVWVRAPRDGSATHKYEKLVILN